MEGKKGLWKKKPQCIRPSRWLVPPSWSVIFMIALEFFPLFTPDQIFTEAETTAPQTDSLLDQQRQPRLSPKKDHLSNSTRLMAPSNQVLNMSSSDTSLDSHLYRTMNHNEKAPRREEESLDREDYGHQQEGEDITIDTEGERYQESKRPASSNSSTPAKRPKRLPSIKCPICHEVVPHGQYQQHYRMELAQLELCTLNDR